MTLPLGREDPTLREAADGIEADYPQFTVSVRFGFFDARYRDPAFLVHYEAPDEDGLRRQLDAAAVTAGEAGPA